MRTVRLGSALIAFAALVVAACNPGPPRNSVEGKIWRQVESGGPVRLADTTHFDWDEVVIIRPYTPRREAEKLIGGPWPGFDASRIEMSDSINAIVFLKENRIVHEIQLSRNRGDFDLSPFGGRFTREAAVFDVTEERGWFTVRPSKSVTPN